MSDSAPSPPPPTGPKAPAADGGPVGAVDAVRAADAAAETDAGDQDAEDADDDDGASSPAPNADDGTRVARIPPWIVVPVALVAAIGAVEHATEPPYSFPTNLNTDIVEVSWIVLFLLVVLLNFAEKIGFPGAGSVTLRRERAELAATAAIDATVDLEDARNRVAQLLQGWSNAASLLTGILEQYGVDDRSVNEITTRFVLDRMEEARPIFAPETEAVRLSLWWYSEALGGLAYLYGTEVVDDTTLTAVFRPREGLMGQAFVENQMYNLRNAPTSMYYKPHRQSAAYRGLLLVPVRDRGTRAMAMLSVDRSSRRVFDATAEAVGWALSDLVSLATPTRWSRSTCRSSAPTTEGNVAAPLVRFLARPRYEASRRFAFLTLVSALSTSDATLLVCATWERLKFGAMRSMASRPRCR